MKTSFLPGLALAAVFVASPPLAAQPTFQFNNRIFNVLVAPIHDVEPADHTLRKIGNPATGTPPGNQVYGGARLPGAGYTAQLFIGPKSAPESDLVPMLPATVFSATSAGYIVPVTVQFPAVVPAGQEARLQMRVWDNQGGAIMTWEQAWADSTVARGFSASWLVVVPSGTPGQSPMAGLRSFNLCLPPVLNWYTFDGGGGDQAGSGYTLSGTVGQPDAGARQGGTYTLAGGFWGVRLSVKVPNPPRLNIARSRGAVLISWPATASGWFLKSTTELLPGGSAWDSVPGPYPIVGTNCVVTVPAPVGQKFYRLCRP